MLKEQKLLRIPGPTPIPPSVQQAMSQPMIGHRSQECKDLLGEIRPKLQAVFGTKEEVIVLTGSGTSGLEAAVVNVVKPNEHVLVLVSGSFGDRFTKICEAYHFHVHRIDVEWGDAVDPVVVKKYLEEHPEIKVVFATYCETSTGVLNPIRELGALISEYSEALFVVDGVSAIGGAPMNMDEWNIDVLVTGSQKALMLPAGLAFIAASKKAWEVIEANRQPSFYLDLVKHRDKLMSNQTPYTPALSLIQGLKQSLLLIEEEGLNEVYQRHFLMKEMTRSAFKALNIPLLADDQFASPTVTAIKPLDFDPEQLRKMVNKEFGLIMAGGQNQLKGKIFRIGHMGYCSPSDVLQTIGLVEMGLKKIGVPIELGAGVRAAQEFYLERETVSDAL